MNKSDLLKAIAERGYDVGFGAKKHFATYDIIEKIPGWIGFTSIAFGIFSLAYTDLATQFTSATFVVLGVVSLYVGFYAHDKHRYNEAGASLTKLYYELKMLYLTLKGAEGQEEISKCERQLLDIESRFFSDCISKQILFSNWYAHYKFYWELQIGWLEEELRFKFFRDKVPLSFWICLIMLACIAGLWIFNPFVWDCTLGISPVGDL
ncbi:MAG: hypothetical protein CME43_01570 [Haliea sp.]|uniref:SLATT domain-containing protein n=1 Tax=Haliea sp. TaxID=1932666 RepID=UPI000C4C4DEE|nr:SLATT domain-containing protein [Haliea sp.]MBM68152.1 hypothetical protein [Haliea sp.]|tara:strand:+ start:48209 stop:48832 length:624 start_codon:yes stop_codon:yes gene_type:complete